jgi:hypothetical protein
MSVKRTEVDSTAHSESWSQRGFMDQKVTDTLRFTVCVNSHSCSRVDKRANNHSTKQFLAI